jgi:hypothetical protein
MTSPTLRTLTLSFGIVVYVVGCLAWIIIPMLAYDGDRWMSWSTMERLRSAALLLALPAGIAVVCLGARGYDWGRLAASLLAPPLIIAGGVLLTPGNLSPIFLLMSGILAGVVVIVLLRDWAKLRSGSNDA